MLNMLHINIENISLDPFFKILCLLVIAYLSKFATMAMWLATKILKWYSLRGKCHEFSHVMTGSFQTENVMCFP